MEEEKNRFWKWGIFYYNPDDKRLFPPKRIPWMGWTVNFANPLSILAMLFLIASLFLFFTYLGSTFRVKH